MSELHPEQVEILMRHYQTAFREVGATVPKELISFTDDCACVVEEATQPFLARVLEDKDMIVLRYEPGYLRVISKLMREWYTKVIAPIRRKEARQKLSGS